MSECKTCGHPVGGGPRDCACECHAAPDADYEPRQIIAAERGWRAVYRLPDGTAYRFVGLENDGSVDASPHEVRQIYQERFEAHVAMVRSMALSTGCDYRRVSTAIPYLQTLSEFLVERSG